MEVLKGYKEIKTAYPRVVLTIGNFDGIHLGHREIIGSVTTRALQERGTSVVYTFRPHPHLVLIPAENLQLLNTYDEKLEFLSTLGVDVTIEEPFSREFSTVTPEKFFRDILVKRLSPIAIYVGYDFGFGKDRRGNLEMLERFAKEEGIEVHVAKPLKINGEICSSSRIRDHIVSGEVKLANKLLGREFFYRGLVVRGFGRGKKIGFATANVHTESKLRIKEGVYATRAVLKGKIYPSVTNVGRQPTFNQDAEVPVVVETHILDFDQDIYGETLEVRMCERIRDEVRFPNVDALVAQIKADVGTARKFFTGP